MLSTLLAVSTLAASAIALPTNEIAAMKHSILKRQSVTTGASNLVVLNFALTLEHLEAVFYAQALQKYTAADFVAAGYPNVYQTLGNVAADEAAHVTFLTGAITAAGGTPVAACNYTFPYTSVQSFLALSQVLEGVGTSAYLGAAGSINGSDYLTAAASILTVEARHNAFIRYINGFSPAPQPNDTPQSAAAVVTMATPFFVACPAGSDPAIKGFPALATTTAEPAIGAMLSVALVNASAVSLTGTVYCGFASGLGAGFSVYQNGSCMVPTANVTNGQTYVVLTSGPSVADSSVLAGPVAINIGAKISTTSGSSNATPSANTNSTSGTGTGTGTGGSGSTPSGSAAPGAASSTAATKPSSASTLKAGSLLATVALAFALLM